MLQFTQCCSSHGELGLGLWGTQGCAEGAQGRSEGMMEMGKAFIVAAAFVTIYNSASQAVK